MRSQIWFGFLFLKNHAPLQYLSPPTLHPLPLPELDNNPHTPLLPAASFAVSLILSLLPQGPFQLFSERDRVQPQIPLVFWIALESGENLLTLTFVILKSGCSDNYTELEKYAVCVFFSNMNMFYCVLIYGNSDFLQGSISGHILCVCVCLRRRYLPLQ